jgi:hypothetical protein
MYVSSHQRNEMTTTRSFAFYVNGVAVDIIEMVVNWNSDFWKYQIKL